MHTSKLRRTLKQLKMPQLMQRNSSANTRLITSLLRRNLMMTLPRKPMRREAKKKPHSKKPRLLLKNGKKILKRSIQIPQTVIRNVMHTQRKKQKRVPLIPIKLGKNSMKILIPNGKLMRKREMRIRKKLT